MSNIPVTADGSHRRARSAGEAFWREVVAAFATSGQSVRVFCQGRGIHQQSFYNWRLKLAKRDRQGMGPLPVELARPAFVPVMISGSGAGGIDSCMEVELRGGRLLRLPGSMPAARLAEVLHALEGQP
jgi:transposase